MQGGMKAMRIEWVMAAYRYMNAMSSYARIIPSIVIRIIITCTHIMDV